MAGGPISVEPDTLRDQSNTYSNGNQSALDLMNQIGNMNETIGGEWKGAAFQAFMTRWEETLRPNLQTIADELEAVYTKLNAHADTMEERDAADAASWN